MTGWIKVHRKIEQWEWYTDANTFRLFFHLVLKANHADKKWRGIIIKRGQIVTSSEHLANQLKLSRQQIRTSLNKLKSTNEITTKSTNKYIIVTIEKYDDYQSEDEKVTNKITDNSTNNQPTNNHQITTNKNEKNNKNEKKERIKDSNNNTCEIDNHHSMIKYDADHQYYKIAIFIRQKILFINDKAKVPKDDPTSMSKWSDDVRKIVELDKRTLAEFQELTEFAFKSDFWSTVIQSPAGFRKNWDKMFAQMKRPVASKGNVISFDRQMEVCRQFLEEG